MSGTATLIKEIPLANSEKGIITVSHLTHPYGEGSKPVVSIGVSLKGDGGHPDWKAHIPYDNVEMLVEALKEAKAKCV